MKTYPFYLLVKGISQHERGGHRSDGAILVDPYVFSKIPRTSGTQTEVVDTLVPGTLDGGILLDGVRDPFSDLAPLRDPIPNGRPHLHRVVVQLTPL